MYTVQFTASGFGQPTQDNPKGIRITVKGMLNVCGDPPKDSKAIPFTVIEACKWYFMEKSGCVRYAGDTENVTRYPTVKLIKPRRSTRR